MLKYLIRVFLKISCYLNLHLHFLIFTIWILTSPFKMRRYTKVDKQQEEVKKFRKHKENLFHVVENV